MSCWIAVVLTLAWVTWGPESKNLGISSLLIILDSIYHGMQGIQLQLLLHPGVVVISSDVVGLGVVVVVVVVVG